MGWWWSKEKQNPQLSAESLQQWPLARQFGSYVQLSPAGKDQIQELLDHWTDAHSVVVGTACVTCFAAGLCIGRTYSSRRYYLRAIRSLQDLSTSDIGSTGPWLRGTVGTVSDGDTVRFLHRPTVFHPTYNSKKYKAGDMLAIRLCTIDAPETAKFGNPGQPYGEEAKEYLKSLCGNRTVRIKILQMDQYGRGVAEIKRRGLFWSTYVDEAMLKAGLAEVYLGTGAVYGRLGKEKYLQIMEKAKSSRKGMWSDKKRESAAEYKRRIKSDT